MTKLKLTILIAAGLVILWLGLRLWAATANPSHDLGESEGRLAPCPDSPNCVSSQAEDADQRMDPLEYSGSAREAQASLEQVLNSMPRSRIVSSKPGYIHAEYRSLLMGFVDDVEFLFDPPAGQIHFRSASRVGYSDLGVNRKRMEIIAERFRARASK